MSKMSDWAIQLEEDFWDIANKTIGSCELIGEFIQEMEPYRDYCGMTNDQDYHDMMREAWDNYWSKYNVS